MGSHSAPVYSAFMLCNMEDMISTDTSTYYKVCSSGGSRMATCNNNDFINGFCLSSVSGNSGGAAKCKSGVPNAPLAHTCVQCAPGKADDIVYANPAVTSMWKSQTYLSKSYSCDSSVSALTSLCMSGYTSSQSPTVGCSSDQYSALK